MYKTYFKTAWRNLLKNKTFSFINIAGLAAGLACFILIALYVADELSYDRYNQKAERIYRINTDVLFGGNSLHLAVTSDPMGAALKNDFPQVEQYVRFYNSNGHRMVKKGSVYIREDRVAYADSTLFDIFTLPAVAGDTRTALSEPNAVVITTSTAKKYFGTSDVVGKTLETDEGNGKAYKITAVLKDIPYNSHFHFDFIFSMDNLNYTWNNYLSHNFQTYLLLKQGTDYRVFEKNFTAYIDKYVLPQAKQFMQINSMEEFKSAGNKLEYSLTPLLDIHLYSDRFPELGVNGNIQYVYIFSAVAFFVLVLACVNFTNLSTARSANRAKEVGIRKVLGTEKKALVMQFLSESVLMAFLSLIVAVIIVVICIPYFNTLSGKSLSVQALLMPGYLAVLLLLPLLTGLLAGAYPAFYLSGFKPIAVLKGKLNAGFKRSNVRNTLVVFQFATSIVLIIGTVVVYRQLNYIQSQKLGFNKEQVLVVHGTGALKNNIEAFKNEVKKISGVIGATYAGYLPVANSSRNDNTFSKEATMDSRTSFGMQSWAIDYDYIPVMGMQIIKGRNFSKDFGGDSASVIINEKTAELLGYDNPIGKSIYEATPGQEGIAPKAYEIIGVVRNFNFESLHQQVGPLCFRLGKSSWDMAFKVTTVHLQNLISQVEQQWKAMAPAMPFKYQFLDESFDNMYRVEQRTGKLGLTFAVIGILIACLGLFGLAAYTAEQRVKEIGVRKVLGASAANIATMLSTDFLKLVLVAAVIAFPVAWWVMNRWLQDFAYRVNISWWIFMVAAAIAVIIALLTVSTQAIKAAMANPVKSLRTE
jgi:putative ABC transport system permease protein